MLAGCGRGCKVLAPALTAAVRASITSAMVDESKGQRFWNRFARRYAAARIRDEAGYERSLARTIEHIGGLAQVLEIGCGTGLTALRLAGAVGHLTATDFSARMIDIARERQAAGEGGNVDFVVASAEALPVKPASCDAVLAFSVLHLLENRSETLGRIRSLLKPGGLLVSKTPCMAELQLRYRWMIPLLRASGLAPRFAMLTGEALARDVEAAGFEIVETARHGSGAHDIRLYLVARRSD